jgi:AbrB family looped-hinge helix DNA binding protein
MITARISSKGQSTIPAEIRRKLAVRPGDSIGFVIDGERVTLQKVQPLDAAFLRLATEAFSEWNSPEADEAFRDL